MEEVPGLVIENLLRQCALKLFPDYLKRNDFLTP